MEAVGGVAVVPPGGGWGAAASAVVVSAPGKVMGVGGYLVTQRPNPAWVLSASPRFLARVGSADTSSSFSSDLSPSSSSSSDLSPSSSSSDAATRHARIAVHSPQFGREWLFTVGHGGTASEGLHIGAAKVGQDKNEFVESALRYGLTTALVLLGRTRFLDRLAAGLRIDLVAHRAFYSSPSPTGTDPEAPPRKTGLGSSAALVSALCGALLAYFGLVHLPDAGATKDEQLDSKDTTTRDLRLVHNLAQFAHFKAQGKIGSGFDVSSAVYGSHVYVRFDPIILQRAGEKPEDIAELISGHWDSEVHALPLPSGLRLMLGDVSAGSKTPVMVSLVDAWRRGLEEEQRLGSPWRLLQELNTQFILALRNVARLLMNDQGKQELVRLGAEPHSKWQESSVGVALGDLRTTFMKVREQLKSMGHEAGVEIEPDSQTELANATMALPGVLIAGVPGGTQLRAVGLLIITRGAAGGMDALFVVTLGQAAEQRVVALWRERGVQELPVQEDNNGLLAHPAPYFAEFVRSDEFK